eukprot:jgi/Botrbrau1/3849/Bobra.0183s0074.1
MLDGAALVRVLHLSCSGGASRDGHWPCSMVLHVIGILRIVPAKTPGEACGDSRCRRVCSFLPRETSGESTNCLLPQKTSGESMKCFLPQKTSGESTKCSLPGV